jgi:hypothetical protein
MTQLSKEFGLSDVALHKICRKHGIPNPPLGWWAKKAAGKPVRRTPLPKNEAGNSDRITIASADFSHGSPILARVREQARILASEGADDQAVPPHLAIDRTLAKLRKTKPSEVGIAALKEAGFIRCEVALSSIDRLAIILPRIVRAALLQGFELVAGEGPARFKSGSEEIGFSITEAIGREKHVLTNAERAREEAWQRKRARVERGRSWDEVFLDRPRFPEWDYHPTGLLSFELEHVYVPGGASPRRSFRDAKVQRLETMASDIAVGIAVLAAAKTEQRLKREAEQRRIEEARQRRELAARLAHIEERRAAELGRILTELDELDRLRRLLAQLTMEASGESTPRLPVFLAWAQEHLKERERRISTQALEERFTAGRLFGDDDDHAFVSGRWY